MQAIGLPVEYAWLLKYMVWLLGGLIFGRVLRALHLPLLRLPLERGELRSRMHELRALRLPRRLERSDATAQLGRLR